ncbi:DUF2812 domain-containing protein [Clostridium botulinum]|uniref:DUF2812 domain-containing protein n=1 Tax=Clostridium botulinum TaxID=1491 RepID=A0A846J1D4_CLOBO|nr:DUF2812 domain-containing protein [Clostridium botulinum]ACA54621.1 conserved hypothetical protein [Clostridium botulinum A3 str. Loch Maree]NFH64321.1 DUF2812 domain-containing protein [Clostridium botulinum]NFJ07100.1 DUF2812 domain-containing protein [Clostridium botulinum]NFK14072.1 DUF2812 domain-containing protein [Clostridium botulinum]NFM92272.1 DUF2812 domain-containing protein [Clostridium botulinum]
MKSKYVMIGGLAFSEESDMEKLRNYASEGWILENIVGGFFYKLKKDKPHDIVYSLDYQKQADEEYLAIFKDAGWKRIVSIGDEMHIFSAQAGTKPIYSDRESEMDKYINAKNRTGKGTLYSLIVAIVLICLSVIPIKALRYMSPIISGLLIIDFIVFIFNFMPYLAYKYRIKQVENNGKCEENKALWKLNAFGGIIFLALGISYLIRHTSFNKFFGIFFIILGVLEIILGLNKYKKHKKTL